MMMVVVVVMVALLDVDEDNDDGRALNLAPCRVPGVVTCELRMSLLVEPHFLDLDSNCVSHPSGSGS